jgi:hypothetical protein
MSDFNEKELIDSMKEAADLASKRGAVVNTNELPESTQAKMDEIGEIFSKRNRAINMKGYGIDDDYKPSLWSRLSFWWENNHPFAGALHVENADEYINLPRSQRVRHGFWYEYAYITGGMVILGSEKERTKLKNFQKKHFPIQYWLREVAYWKIRIALSNTRDWISYTLNPRQKWLTKQIPKSWADKTWLIPELNFAMVVDFVEGEQALDVTDWDASSEGHSQFAKELKECYDYIKVRRPKLQSQFENSYPDEETMTGEYEIDYAEHNRLEVLINKEDTKYLVWIVTNRDYFWA